LGEKKYMNCWEVDERRLGRYNGGGGCSKDGAYVEIPGVV
jgi:hypothetical protein